MNKIHNIPWILLIVLAFVSCKTTKQNTVNQSQTTTQKAVKKPKNILFIAVDDLKPLLHAYGENQMHTPNFDRLSKMGVTFTNAYVQQAVCGPSRASVMTGTRPDRTKVWDLHTNFRESAPGLYSMPEYLIKQGYETTGVGKIYHQGSVSPGHDAKSWSVPYAFPDNYDPKYGTPAFNFYQDPETKKKMAQLEAEAKAKGLKRGKIRKYVFKRIRPSTESVDVSDEAYLDGLVAKTVIEQINTLSKTDKPFFIAAGFHKPHLPFVAPKKYWDLYKPEDIKLAKFQQLAKGTPLLAYHSFGELRAYSDIDNNLTFGDTLPKAKQRQLVHGYMAGVSYIDAQIGKLLDALKKKGLDKNTIIVLWGDHGYHLGDHTEWCKHSNFQQATRIPMIVVGQGVPKGKMIDTPVELLDLFPTIFELAGVKKPAQAEGKSLVPLFYDDTKNKITQDFAVSQYHRGKDKEGYSIRTKRYRYTEWHKNTYRSYKPYEDSNIVGLELYDYEKDPLETRNLVNDPAYKAVVATLKAKLKGFLNKEYKRLNSIK